MWARNYQSCTECNTTEAKHYGGGLCYRCYKRKKYAANPGYFKDKEKVRYIKRAKHIKRRARNYYWLNRDDCLIRNKISREQRNFSGKREIVLKRDGYKCKYCQGNKDLVVHHVDGNGRGNSNPNNDLENLITLCRSCHCIEHIPRLVEGLIKRMKI